MSESHTGNSVGENSLEKTERQKANEAKRLAKLDKFKAKQDKLEQEKAEQSGRVKEAKVSKTLVSSQEVIIPATPIGEKKGIRLIIYFCPISLFT